MYRIMFGVKIIQQFRVIMLSILCRQLIRVMSHVPFITIGIRARLTLGGFSTPAPIEYQNEEIISVEYRHGASIAAINECPVQQNPTTFMEYRATNGPEEEENDVHRKALLREILKKMEDIQVGLSNMTDIIDKFNQKWRKSLTTNKVDSKAAVVDVVIGEEELAEDVLKNSEHQVFDKMTELGFDTHTEEVVGTEEFVIEQAIVDEELLIEAVVGGQLCAKEAEHQVIEQMTESIYEPLNTENDLEGDGYRGWNVASCLTSLSMANNSRNWRESYWEVPPPLPEPPPLPCHGESYYPIPILIQVTRVIGDTYDEDVNWRVQRATVKCLAALIVSPLERLSRLFGEAVRGPVGLVDDNVYNMALTTHTVSKHSSPIGIAFDIDGVILHGATLIGNSGRALRRLYDDSDILRISFLLLTNGGSIPEYIRAVELSDLLGVKTWPSEVGHDHSALRKLLKKFKDEFSRIRGSTCHALQMLKVLSTEFADGGCAVATNSVCWSKYNHHILVSGEGDDEDNSRGDNLYFNQHINIELPERMRKLINMRLLNLMNCYNLSVSEPGFVSSLVSLKEIYMLGSFNTWEVEKERKYWGNASINELEFFSDPTTLQIEMTCRCKESLQTSFPFVWSSKDGGLGLISCDIQNGASLQWGSTMHFEFHAVSGSLNESSIAEQLSQGLQIIYMPGVNARKGSDHELLNQLVLEHKVPHDFRYSLVMRLRFVRALSSLDAQKQYTGIHVYAFNILVQACGDDDLVTFFNAELEFINELVTLLIYEDAILKKLRISSFLSLDALCQARSCRPTLFTAVTSRGHHGISTIHMREVISAVVHYSSKWSEELLPLVAALLSSPSSSHAKCEVGFIPTSLSMLKDTDAQHLQLVSLRNNTSTASNERLIKLEQELGALRELNDRWETEKVLMNRVLSIKEEIDRINIEMEAAERNYDSNFAAELKKGNLMSLKRQLEEAGKSLSEYQRSGKSLLQEEVTNFNVADIARIWMTIMVFNLQQSEITKLFLLEQSLQIRVVDQDMAVKHVADTKCCSRALISYPNPPIASFTFMGPTGLGKTKLVKALTKYHFETEKVLVQINISEYMEEQAVSQLIGATPTHDGHEVGGQLTEVVCSQPYSVALIIVIEKACNKFGSRSVDTVRMILTPLFKKGYAKDPATIAKAASQQFNRNGLKDVIVEVSKTSNEFVLELLQGLRPPPEPPPIYFAPFVSKSLEDKTYLRGRNVTKEN